LRTITTSTGRFPSFNPARASAAGERQSTPRGRPWNNHLATRNRFDLSWLECTVPVPGPRLIDCDSAPTPPNSIAYNNGLPALDLGQAKQQTHLIATIFPLRPPIRINRTVSRAPGNKNETSAQLLSFVALADTARTVAFQPPSPSLPPIANFTQPGPYQARIHSAASDLTASISHTAADISPSLSLASTCSLSPILTDHWDWMMGGGADSGSNSEATGAAAADADAVARPAQPPAPALQVIVLVS
jgi:hypothetical protein